MRRLILMASMALASAFGPGGAIGVMAGEASSSGETLLGIETGLALEDALALSLGESLPPEATLHLLLPEGAPARLRRVTRFEQHLESGQFGARIETLDGQMITLQGRFEARIEIPVPNRSLMPGEIARPEHFTSRSLPLNAMSTHLLRDMAQIEGREVRRVLAQGRPVQSQSLQEPRAVLRGEKLVLHYRQGPLELTARVKALEDGTLDQPIRVLNLTSNKTITAIARGEGRAEIEQ